MAVEKTETGERLYLICEEYGVTLPALAEKLSLPYSSLYKWTNGQAQPTHRLYVALYQLGVDVNWFVSGEGEIKRD